VACDLVRVIANAACFARGAHAYRPASEHPGAASAPNIDPRQAEAGFSGSLVDQSGTFVSSALAKVVYRA
jgi:hypothetical protein